MKVLDLFSGIGGFSLGLERAGMETVAFCEIEEYPRQVLRKHWPDIPIFKDVKKLRGENVGPIDLICGGYPCQPFSLAGERRGHDDDRHLWPEMLRLLQETKPRWFIGENVAGHISMGLDQVLFDLESEGYEAQTFIIPACGVDAPHRRDRVWIVAHANERDSRQGSSKQPERPQPCSVCQGVLADSDSSSGNPGPQHSRRETRGNIDKHVAPPGSMANTNSGQRKTSEQEIRPGWNTINNGCNDVANTQGPHDGRGDTRKTEGQKPEPGNRGCQGNVCNTHTAGPQERKVLGEGEGEARSTKPWETTERTNRWPIEPPVGRVAHGIPRRVDRLKSLGNAVVPQIPEIIGRAIMAIEAA